MVAIGRPREFDREAALDKAMRLFWRKGFSTTSMTDLCDAMGIRSPSLYAAFGSKEALYLEALDHYVRTIGYPVWGSLSTEPTARAAVEQSLLAATESLPEAEGVPAGCMAMLAAVADDWPSALVDVAQAIRRETLDNVRSRLRTAMEEGELAPTTDVDRLSRFYVGVMQGMAVQAKDGADAADLKGLVGVAMAAWPAK